MFHVLALAGVLGISFSPVIVRLASVSPVTAAFFRAAYAVPVLLVLWMTSRSKDSRPSWARLLAFVSGSILSLDLAFWHESIALIGAGLATVITNVQVIFVAAGPWLFYRERPSAKTIATIVVVLVGVVMTSGLA